MHPINVLELTQKEVDVGGGSLAFIAPKVPAAVALIKHFRVLATSVSLHAPAIGAFPSTYSIIRHDYIKSINKDDYVTD